MDYPDEYLECLCEDCHEEATRVQDRLQSVIGLLNQNEIQSVIAHAEELAYMAAPRRPIPIPWKVYERRLMWAHSVVSKIFPDEVSAVGMYHDHSMARVTLLQTLLTCLEGPAGYDSGIPVDNL